MNEKSGFYNSNITAMRFFCASLVIISHLNWFQGNSHDPLRRLGIYAVAVFFGLSGFLLTNSLRKRNDVSAFIRNRILRVFPGFYFILIVTSLLFAPIIQSKKSESLSIPRIENLKYIFSNLTTVMVKPTIGQSLDELPVQSWNPPLWTISYEILCYLCLLLLYIFFKKKLNRVIFIFMSISITAWAVVGFFDLMIPVIIHTFFYYFSFFSFGCLLSFMQLRVRTFAFLGSLFLFSIIYFMPYRDPIQYFERKDFLIGILLVPISLFICNNDKVKTNIRNDYSYGMYIFGAPVTQLCIAFELNRRINEYFFYILILLFTFICAFFSWHLVEKKALRLKS